tara:strand:+ start:101 stop:364 length:264 start_codon:yes stop_codon:yes gene_type:complete
MKKIQKKKTLRRIAFLSLSVVVLSNADENDSPRKLFLSLSLSKYRGKERPPRNDVLNNNNNNNNNSNKKLSLSSLSSLSLDFSSRLI